eukprot:s405_g30.t1
MDAHTTRHRGWGAREQIPQKRSVIGTERRHNDVFEFHMAPKIPPCSLSSDLEATFEAAQTQDVIQRSCNIFLAANDSDWVHGVAVAAAGLKLLSYNRSNFFENLKLQQSRKFRRQQIIAAQANLFRSDVQQVIGASVTVQERLTIVSTLMLVASTYSFGVGLPRESADFLEGLVYLTLSNSSLYFLLALFSCISASILARTSQKVLLNNCVRPPFEEMSLGEDMLLTPQESQESAEHFERQGVSALLRIPGSHFLEERFGSELLRLRAWRSGKLDAAEEVGSLSLNRLLSRHRSNNEAMNRLQLLWDDLATYAPYYLSWGIRNLLLAYAFRSMGFYYHSRDFDVFLQTSLWIIVTLALGVLTNMVMPSCWAQSLIEHGLILAGIGLSVIDATFSTFTEKVWWKREGLNHEVSSITAPFVCQLGLLVSAHVRFYINTKGGPMLQTFREIGSNISFRQDLHYHQDLSSGTDSDSEAAECEISDFLQGHIKRQSRLRDGVRTTCLIANIAMILIWLAVCCGEAEIWRQLPRAVKATEEILDEVPKIAVGPNITDVADISVTLAPKRILREGSAPLSAPVLLDLTSPRGHVVSRYPGSITIREVLESQGLRLGFSDRLFQRRLVVRDRQRATQVNHDLPLSALLEPPDAGLRNLFCHEHLIQVRCPHLYRLVQDRVNGAASGSDTAEPDDNLDSLLRAVKDDNVKVPRHAPPGWMASECSSHCYWIPVDLPQIILHHFLLFLYSDSTRPGRLWTEAVPSLRDTLLPPQWNMLGGLPVVLGLWLARFPGQLTEFFQDYRTLDDIHRYIDLLAQQHPTLVTLREIGRSWQGRPLKVLEITSPSGNVAEKPCIFLEGSLVQDASPDVQSMLQHFLFTLLVPVNPDGYVYSWEVNRMWRKTRSNRSNYLCYGAVAGVDANRNWGVTFGQTDSPEAFSEPETKAASDYMKERQQNWRLNSEAGAGYVAAFIDYHSYAEAMLPPWAYTAETPADPDGAYQTSLTSFINEAFYNTSGRTFNAGADVFPPDPGTGPDWAYGLLGIRATMTIELEGHSFCLPAIQIENAGVKALATFIRQHGGEPSAQVGIFAPGNGSTSLLVAANQRVSQPVSSWLIVAVTGGVILVAFAALVAMRNWFNWFSSSRRNYRVTGPSAAEDRRENGGEETVTKLDQDGCGVATTIWAMKTAEVLDFCNIVQPGLQQTKVVSNLQC